MSRAEHGVRVMDAPAADAVPETPEDLLDALGGPALLRQAGREPSRTRVVATLLHGNEPSGVRAVHHWLRSGATPRPNALFFVAAVAAAREPPGFAHRALPGHRDLNRCFLGPFDGAEGALAESVLAALREARPEALVDLHNNTGHNPAYGVGPAAGPAQLVLAALFADRFVHSTLRLGALVEATDAAFPSVTIECGRAGDPAADAVARAGLERFLADAPLDPRRGPPRPIEVLRDPVRVRIRSGVRLAFGERPLSGADLTVVGDLDRHNFESLRPGVRIGWLGSSERWPVEARGGDGRDVSRELFEATDGVLRTAAPLTPIMMTTDADVAASDCLFYAVCPARAPGRTAPRPARRAEERA